MEDDIDLIFSRISDRLDDFQSRINQLKLAYKNIEEDIVDVRKEIQDIDTNVEELDDDLRNVNQMQNDVIIDLATNIRSNGIFIGKGWNIQTNPSNGNLFIRDLASGGYYRFLTTSQNLDV